MKESSNWHPPIRQEGRSRAHTKRFSIPYPEALPGRSPPSTPAANNKRQHTLLDKENSRMWEKPERKKTISPEKKKCTRRKNRAAQQNIIGYLNKTEDLHKVMQPKPSKVVTPCGSHADFIRGKSAESKRQRKVQWDDRQYRDMSLSLKNRSLSRELKRILKPDNRDRSRGKRPSTELNGRSVALKPQTIPLMRDILREIKKESENVKRKEKEKEKEGNDSSLHQSKKLKKERKKSLQSNLSKRLPPTKTVNTAPSQPRLKKRRISTVVEELAEPGSDSLRYRQSTEEAYLPSYNRANNEIEVVRLTEAEEFDLNEFREFEHRYFQKDRKSKRHPVLLTAELKTEMAIRIQRWWRRILTRRLVKQFIRHTRQHSQSSNEIYVRTDSEDEHAGVMEAEESRQVRSELNHQDLNFHEDVNMRKVTYISNLSGEEEGSQAESMKLPDIEPSAHQFVQDDVMNRIKQKELEKLNDFITLIKESLSGGGRAHTQELLKKLVERSELNCKSLEKQPQIVPAVELTEPLPTEKFTDGMRKEPVQQAYEEIDDDYKSRGKSSSSNEGGPDEPGNSEEVLSGQIDNTATFYGLQKRPITPSLEYQQSSSEQEKIPATNDEPQRLVLKDQEDMRAFPLSMAARERLLYDRTHSPGSRSSSESSNHELMSYIQDEAEDDPLSGLQAAERLRKKLEQLNSRTFEAENEADLFMNESDEEAPPLRRYPKPSLSRGEEKLDEELSSGSSSEWEAFPRLQRLLQILPDKERLSDDTAHIILTHLITQFLKDISSTPIVRTFKVFALKLRDKDKKVITVKKAVFRKSKGIKTNIAAVKEYLKAFNLYLIQKRPQLLKRLDQPAAPSARELLRYMHPYEESSESCEDSSVLVLPVQLFDEYWQHYEKQLPQPAVSASQLERSEFEYVHRITHIHCRAIFDGFNQCLNFERNYGEFGKPFPWKSAPNFERRSGIAQYKSALEKAYQRTIQISSSYCGIIFDKQDASPGILPTKQHMEQMHEDRLSRALVLEVKFMLRQMYETEKNWLFYDDEETEVVVELAHNVCEFLVREIVEQMQRLQRLRSLLHLR